MEPIPEPTEPMNIGGLESLVPAMGPKVTTVLLIGGPNDGERQDLQGPLPDLMWEFSEEIGEGAYPYKNDYHREAIGVKDEWALVFYRHSELSLPEAVVQLTKFYKRGE